MIKNILLAEDDRGTALLVKTQLERCGYTVKLATNGVEALNLVLTEPVDLIITDVVMPEMDGVDLYMELKKNKATMDIPVIIVTDKQVFRDSFMTLGVDHFVAKTSDISNLINEIKNIDSLSKAPREYHKVLVGGSRSVVLEQMKQILHEKGCLVTTAENSIDLISKAFLMSPQLIIIDIFLSSSVSAREIIRSFRCYDFLHHTAIATYVNFNPLDVAPAEYEGMNLEVQACKESGANCHLGQFNATVFPGQLKEFGIK